MCVSVAQWASFLAPFFFKQPWEVGITTSHADEETKQDMLSTTRLFGSGAHGSQVGKKWADKLELK